MLLATLHLAFQQYMALFVCESIRNMLVFVNTFHHAQLSGCISTVVDKCPRRTYRIVNAIHIGRISQIIHSYRF